MTDSNKTEHTAEQLFAKAQAGFSKAEQDLGEVYRNAFLLAREIRKHGVEAMDSETIERIEEAGAAIESTAYISAKFAERAAAKGKEEGNWAVVQSVQGAAGEQGLLAMLEARRETASRMMGNVTDLREATTDQEREQAARNIINDTIRIANEAVDQGRFSGLNDRECADMSTWFSNSVSLSNESISRRSVADEITPRYILARLDIERTGREFVENRDIARYLREVRAIIENDFAGELMSKADRMTLDTISTTFGILKARIEAAELQVAQSRGIDLPAVHNWLQLVLRLPDDRPFEHRRFERQVTAGMSEALIAAVGGEHAYRMVSNYESKRDRYAEKLERVLDSRAHARASRDQITAIYSDAEGRLAALHPVDVINSLATSQIEAVSQELPRSRSKILDARASKEVMLHGLETVAKSMRSNGKSGSGIDI